MSINDRESRALSQDKPSPLYERRVTPTNDITPKRVDPPSLLAPKPPRGPDLTGKEKRLPAKR